MTARGQRQAVLQVTKLDFDLLLLLLLGQTKNLVQGLKRLSGLRGFEDLEALEDFTWRLHLEA